MFRVFIDSLHCTVAGYDRILMVRRCAARLLIQKTTECSQGKNQCEHSTPLVHADDPLRACYYIRDQSQVQIYSLDVQLVIDTSTMFG